MDGRIRALVAAVPACDRVADVGTDHGLTAIGLAKRSDIRQVLATDISKGSLAKLEEKLELAGPVDWAKKISPLLGPGLLPIPGEEAPVLVLSGMGGMRILSILRERWTWALGSPAWILSPQSDQEDFRRFLKKEDLDFSESLLEEGGKFYSIFQVRPGQRLSKDSPYAGEVSDCSFRYGADLVKKRDPILKSFLEKKAEEGQTLLEELGSLSPAPSASVRERMEQVEKEKEEIRRLLDQWAQGEEA